MMRTIVNTLMVQSAAGGLLIAFMMLLRKVCAEKISARLMYALWFLVALRMLVPLELPGLILTDKSASVVQNAFYTSEADFPEAYGEQNGETMPRSEEAEKEIPASFPSVNEKSVEQAEENPSATVQELCIGRISLYTAAFYGWLGGVFLTGAYMLATNLCYMRRVKKQAVPVHTKCALPVYRAEVESPFLAGIFRKRIYINEAARQEGRLSYVLAHEEEHSRNQDNLWLLLRNVVCALYWFHPLVWIAAALSTRDCEKACDERVISSFSKSERVDYAQILFEMSVGQRRVLPMVNAVGSGTGVTMVRVERILKSRSIRRWVSVMTAVIMLTASAFSCATGEPLNRSGQLVNSLLMDDERILYVMDDGVYSMDDRNEFVELFSYPGILNAKIDGDMIYLNSTVDRRLITVCGMDGSKKDVFKLTEDEIIIDYAVSAPYLCYSYMDDRMLDSHLAVYNMATGETEEIKEAGNPHALAMDGKKLAAYCEEMTGPTLRLIDLANGENRIVIESAPMGTQLYLDAEKNTCYVVYEAFRTGRDESTVIEEGKVYKVVWGKEGEQVQIQRTLLTNLTDKVSIANGMLYGYDYESGRLTARDLDSVDQNKLVVASIGTGVMMTTPLFTKSVDIMQEKYDVQVQVRNYNSRDELILDLLSGMEQIDLLMMNGFDYVNFLRADTMVDLNEFEAFSETKSSGTINDWFFEIADVGGSNFMVPFGYVCADLWRADTELLEQLNLQLPDADWTWADFLEMAKVCGEHNVSILPDSRGTYIFHPGGKNYINAFVDPFAQEAQFDTEAFREMSEAWKICIEEGYTAEKGANKKNLFTPQVVTAFTLTNAENEGAKYAYLPQLGGETVIDVDLGLIGVSRSSQQPELAAAFILTCLSPEVQALEWLPELLIYSDLSWYTDRYEDAPTEEEFAFYNDMMSKASPRDEVHQVRIVVYECLTRYIRDEMTLDEAVSEISQRVDMILYE